MEDGHGARDLADELHVVLDDHDRGGLVDLADQGGSPGVVSSSLMPAAGSSSSTIFGCADD